MDDITEERDIEVKLNDDIYKGNIPMENSNNFPECITQINQKVQ